MVAGDINAMVEADIQTTGQDSPTSWAHCIPGTGRHGPHVNYTGLLMNGCGRSTGTIAGPGPGNRAAESQDVHDSQRLAIPDNNICVSAADSLHDHGCANNLAYT